MSPHYPTVCHYRRVPGLRHRYAARAMGNKADDIHPDFVDELAVTVDHFPPKAGQSDTDRNRLTSHD